MVICKSIAGTMALIIQVIEMFYQLLKEAQVIRSPYFAPDHIFQQVPSYF